MQTRILTAALAVVLGTSLAGPAAASTSAKQARCLALAMYWEAKTEGEEGMLAVASVVLNRVADAQFPGSVCAVVKQGGEAPPCQFSWWCDGKSDRPTEADAWATASRIADRAMRQPPSDRTDGALFFHSTAINAPWVRKRQRTVQIGRHVFYR